MEWTPVLDGNWKQKAQEAVAAIAEDLYPYVSSLGDPTLSNGLAGLAVFYAYLARIRSEEHDEVTAVRLLEQAIDAVGTTPMNPSLHGGFMGIAWAAAHLNKQLGDPEAGDPLEGIDELLLTILHPSPWDGDFDLVNGLVGYGIYALERLPNPNAAVILTHIVDRLDERAEASEGGITWFTRPELLYEKALEESPNGSYNLGIAHGIPGVIGLLGAVFKAGIARPKVQKLLKGAVHWLLAHQLPEPAPSLFARCLGPGIEPVPSRAAWCYGDPGIASALLMAADAAADSTWRKEARRIARHAAARNIEEAGVVDAGFCHGSSGLAHMFNRMYLHTGDPQLAAAARFWLEKTLDMRTLGQGIGGFFSCQFEPDGRTRLAADPSVIYGAAGIGLVLLSAASPVRPDWDRMFLLSSLR